LGISSNTVLRWKIEDGVILVHPVPPDPVRAALGALRGKGSSEEFLQERGKERAREMAKGE